MRQEFDWAIYTSHLGELPPLTQLWERELVAEVERCIPQQNSLRVLEIGCSNGRWLR